MLHKEYFENPFPINISFEDIQDFHNKNNVKKARKCYEIFTGDDIVKKTTLLYDMSRKYIKNNFCEGVFAIIIDAHELVSNCEEHDIFNEMDIDLSHMQGMEIGEVQILAIPFNTIEKVEEFGKKMQEISQVEYWGYGEMIGDNFSDCSN
ncbi:MAG TPA: hypothetical protein VMZ91_08760 [Candidatus Paceibacterota bacterium]|nr:hypothetical protein [Candidatus Paceibacterota bacterium]